MNYTAVGLLIAGVIGFYNAAEWEARDGSPHHGMIWAFASFVLSVLVLFVFAATTMIWLLAQGGLFIAIAAVRVWLEERARR